MPDLPSIPTAEPADESSPASKAGEVQLDCVGCGSFVAYEPGTTGMICGHCRRRQPIDSLDDVDRPVRELDLGSALAATSTVRADEVIPNGHGFRCEDCGVQAIVEGWSGHCPYCDSPVVVVAEERYEALVPGAVLPFDVSRERAQKAFRSWVRGLWFVPGDLVRRLRTPEVNGVYLPYWTYDSRTRGRYRGQRGEYYWKTKVYRGADGKQQSRRVRKTRWYPAAGEVEVAFDDLLVYASETLPQGLIETLEPWDLGELQPYRPEYLSGFVAERHRVDVATGFTLAERRMMPVIRRAVKSDIGGDTQRIHSLEVVHEDSSFKYCLLPLWLATFHYRDEVYRFVVNARTGEASGERPYSLPKILLTLLLVVAVISWIAYLNGAFSS